VNGDRDRDEEQHDHAAERGQGSPENAHRAIVRRTLAAGVAPRKCRDLATVGPRAIGRVARDEPELGESRDRRSQRGTRVSRGPGYRAKPVLSAVEGRSTQATPRYANYRSEALNFSSAAAPGISSFSPS
jgi:hypothetical protein